MHLVAIVVLFFVAGYPTDARSPTRPPPPCPCPKNYAPVCGTNGVTYANGCLLRCAQKHNSAVKPECGGPCPCTCDCNSGKTTSKKCETECAQSKDVCLQPKVSGPCEAYNLVWFYNVNTKQCEQFVYGGCQGNGNRFARKDQCEKTCVKTQTQDPCKQPKSTGPCMAAFPRWYYNSKTADCVQFIYGGCQGNENNFKSRQQCLDKCYVVQ